MKISISLFAVLVGLFAGSSVTADEPGDAKKQTFWIIPHTHWEGAVFKTREEYPGRWVFPISSSNMLTGGATELSFHPRPGGISDVRPFLERYPAEECGFPPRFPAEG